MANELQVIDANGNVRSLRSVPLADGSHAQVILVAEGPEVPASVTGATVRYTVDNAPAVALDPPNAGARYARVRVYEAAQSTSLRLYYRSDGTAPTADGANAFGYLLHGELIMVKVATFAN